MSCVYAELCVSWPCERLQYLNFYDMHYSAQMLNCIDPIKCFVWSPVDFVVIFPMNLSRLEVFDIVLKFVRICCCCPMSFVIADCLSLSVL